MSCLDCGPETPRRYQSSSCDKKINASFNVNDEWDERGSNIDHADVFHSSCPTVVMLNDEGLDLGDLLDTDHLNAAIVGTS